ncbi:MAG TPA: hypothetical protein VFG91_01665 [Woeseiaceae bacterium]|nr:hypothetical protein [Woeseiaceae bacterium]
MDRETRVHVDLDGQSRPVGRLYSRVRRGRETASFAYDATWLAHDERFALGPALQLGPGPFHAGADRPLFIGGAELDRMESAFAHGDLEHACSFTGK